MIARTATLCVLMVATPVFSQTPADMPPQVVDLAGVLKLATDANPRLALEQQNLAVARAERRTAGALPNPAVSYTRSRQPGESTNFDGPLSREWSIEQPIPLPGQRSSRVKAADLGIDAANARIAAMGNELAADAGAAYVALLAAQEKQALLTASLHDLRQLRDVVAGRNASGMASEYDVLRVDVELADWRARVAEADADLIDRQGQLAVLLGFPSWRPLGRADELHPRSLQSNAPEAKEHPALAAARREEAAAQANVVVAHRERLPNLSVNTGQFWTTQPYGRTHIVGLAVEVPLFDTRRGAYDKARAEAKSAGWRRTLVEAQVRADVERYAAQVRERTAALEEFRQQVEPRLPALRRMADDAYRLGRSSIAELLDAARASHETGLNRIDLIANLLEAQLRLRAARGELTTAELTTSGP